VFCKKRCVLRKTASFHTFFFFKKQKRCCFERHHMSSSSHGRAENRGRRRLFSPTLPTPFFSETTKKTPTKLPTCLPHGGRREDALLRRLHSGRPGHPTPLAGVLGVFPPSVFTYKYREGQQQEKKEGGRTKRRTEKSREGKDEEEKENRER